MEMRLHALSMTDEFPSFAPDVIAKRRKLDEMDSTEESFDIDVLVRRSPLPRMSYPAPLDSSDSEAGSPVMRPYSREMSPASSLQLSQSKSKPANIRVFAATSKACGHCALTACHLCVSGAQRVPPVSCHVPEHGRSVCSSCALQHRSIEVSASRAMFVPSELQVAFAEAFKLSASLDSAMVPMPFRYFYTHLNGNARCFEVFDAVDTSIWKEPLSFTHIFVFPNETLAQTFHSNFAAYLAPLTSLPGFASRVKLSICAQCCTYQVQGPANREAADPTSEAVPNVYSASLCRKNNPSHTKKYRSRTSPTMAELNSALFGLRTTDSTALYRESSPGRSPLLLSSLAASPRSRSSRTLIIDSDGSVDDALAIAVATKQAHVAALLSTHGDISVTEATRVLQGVKKHFQMEASVFEGSGHPLVGRFQPRPVERPGITICEAMCPVAPILTSWTERASIALIRTLIDSPDRTVDVVCFGPLTNLALALKIEPRIIQRARSWWISHQSTAFVIGPYPIKHAVQQDTAAAAVVLQAFADAADSSVAPLNIVSIEPASIQSIAWSQFDVLAGQKNLISDFLHRYSASFGHPTSAMPLPAWYPLAGMMMSMVLDRDSHLTPGRLTHASITNDQLVCVEPTSQLAANAKLIEHLNSAKLLKLLK